MAFTPQPYRSEFQPARAMGAAAPIPLAASMPAVPEWQPPKLAKRPKHLLLAQISPGTPGAEAVQRVPYSVMVALILGGITVGFLSHPHRESAIGGLVFGAAASVVGVGITLLIVELVQ